MKKNQKKILIVSFPIIIIICFVYFISYRLITREEVHPTQVRQTFPVIILPQIEAKPLSGDSFSSKTEAEKEEEKVSLIVFEKKYEVAIKENYSVYRVMENLQREEDFTFSYKEYPSLGIFINKINNMEGEGGKYWIYYVNDKEASIGVSEYILKDGDIIKWELK